MSQGRQSWVGTLDKCPPNFCWNLNEMGQVPTHFFIPQWQHNSVWKIPRLKIFLLNHFLEASYAPVSSRFIFVYFPFRLASNSSKVEASNTNLRDNKIRQMFRKLHAGYSNMLYNPSYVPGAPIDSKKFHGVIQSLLQVKNLSRNNVQTKALSRKIKSAYV